MVNPDYLVRLVAIFLFIVLHAYWRIADKGIGDVFEFKTRSFKDIFNKPALSYFQVIVVMQLLGINILPLKYFNYFQQLLGLVIMLLGLILCITARRTLGDNWTNAKDYEAKKTHSLVTNGIYGVIRHPIYLGVTLIITGGEVVSTSYLIIFLPFVYYWVYKQAKKEEVMLGDYFGRKYQKYLKSTSMFIPSIV